MCEFTMGLIQWVLVVACVTMSEHGSVAASAPSVSKAGRKAHWISDEYFTRLGSVNKKTYRYNQQCNHCSEVFNDAKAETMLDHLLMSCPGISPEARAEVVARKAADSKSGTSQTVATMASLPTTRAAMKVENKTRQGRLYGSVQGTGIPDATQKMADKLQLNAAASAGITFEAFENPHFLKWITYISRYSDYIPASKYAPFAWKLFTVCYFVYHLVADNRYHA